MLSLCRSLKKKPSASHLTQKLSGIERQQLFEIVSLCFTKFNFTVSLLSFRCAGAFPTHPFFDSIIKVAEKRVTELIRRCGVSAKGSRSMKRLERAK